MKTQSLQSIFRLGAIALTLAGTIAVSTASAAQPGDYWSPSWMAATQPMWDNKFVLPLGVPSQYNQQTIRQTARLSIGGSKLRVVISNEDGIAPLHIGAAHLARHDNGSAIVASTDSIVYFGGKQEVVVPVGGRMISDPINLSLPALTEVAVSLYLPKNTQPSGFHFDARDTAYVVDGDMTGAERLPGTASQYSTRVFFSGLIVETEKTPTTVVALGDSLTDGNGSTPGANTRWPDALAERLAERGVGVLNAGISGGRLLKDGMGRAGLVRAARDVFAQPGVKAVIVKFGTNDIGWPGGGFAPDEAMVSADDIIQGYRELIEMAHANNVRIIGGTIAPNEGVAKGSIIEGHHSPEKDKIRQAVNQWIRESDEFDGVVDFDAVLRDPANPARMKAELDSGDHLHPGDAGYKAMAAAIDIDALLGSSLKP
ncbi:SGNH/GDSL hydrolase family protein [Brucella pecoris]|uniref:Lysophospholipase L1-like esterase n=1 Tax=Brucella pecoris TaxID=867683 RepID=A0A5C5CH93_9HYPH|nr:SGNH/GDSL hydrolase family protein [Brucella pecoris]MBB4095296.1 lysophospholipase L1-like esterase [Brucella pecoris]TNV10494.1 SGNH/GDSL hydrolase family protein [Brucella pecoris]